MIRIQAQAFDPGAELARFAAGDHGVGAVSCFLGRVRASDPGGKGETSPGGTVTAITLDHYPAMTERELARIEAEARRRFDISDCLVIHRHGRLAPGDPIVLVLVASAHRQAAFDACAFLTDWLKIRAPFWKREETASGARWVEARDSDTAAAASWDDPQAEN